MSMKVFLAQQNYHIGDFKKNVTKIVHAIEKAKAAGGDLIVFSELSVCGYQPGDLLQRNYFLDQCELAVNEIAACAIDIAVLIGAPVRNIRTNGKGLYNAALFLVDGEVKNVIAKTCLPDYDVFTERRYFDPASAWEIIRYKGKKIAVTICEDIWAGQAGHNYPENPVDQLKSLNPDLMINLSASPFDYLHTSKRKSVVKANALKYELPILYCNTVGCHTDIVFDGGSLAYDRDGNQCGELKSFEEDFCSFLINDTGSIECGQIESTPEDVALNVEDSIFNPQTGIEKIYGALILGIRDYFNKMGFSKAIIGNSGGIDSAVVLALACAALGSENVTAVLMPSAFSSDHSVSDAEQLSKNLQQPYHIISINEVYESFLKELNPLFTGLTFSVAEENLQSRIRGNILMTVANKFNYILLNTSNKSELATGYGTLYGDMAGGLSVLGDCYKQQVYALAQHINKVQEIIPNHIIQKAPSAELRPNQKDSDSLPDYAVLDAVLFGYIEKNQSAEDLKAQGYPAETVDRVVKLVNRNEYKRAQFCPIIRISPKSFGSGRKMPVVAQY